MLNKTTNPLNDFLFDEGSLIFNQNKFILYPAGEMVSSVFSRV